MDDPLYVDCPLCLAVMGQECSFLAPAPHACFHPERIAAAAKESAPDFVHDMSKDAVDRAFSDAIDAL